MKLVFIIGDAAVGKMTVGQELMKITDLRLFHNHMTIEPTIEIMGHFDGKLRDDMRELIFRHFAASDNYGMIFTYMMDFDMQSEWDYLEHVKSIFAPYGTEFYYVWSSSRPRPSACSGTGQRTACCTSPPSGTWRPPTGGSSGTTPTIAVSATRGRSPLKTIFASRTPTFPPPRRPG